MKQLAVLILFATLTSCIGNNCNIDRVIFTGIDQRECFCCGGFMIDFSGNPEPYAGEFKLAYELPAAAGITWESEFPIEAIIRWEPQSDACDVIRVLKVWH